MLPRRRRPRRPPRYPPERRAATGTPPAPTPGRRPGGPGSSRTIQGKPRSYPETPLWPWTSLELAPKGSHPLLHAKDPFAGSRLRFLSGATPIVIHLNDQVAFLIGDLDRRRGLASVPRDVRQRLLHDSKRRDVDAEGKRSSLADGLRSDR